MLNAHLVEKHSTLSPQLQRIAQYVLDHPTSVATSTIADLSDALGVQPSSFIRFSKAVGFKGFSEIQRIMKSAVRDLPVPDYFDRLRSSSASDAEPIGRFGQLAASSLGALPDQADIDRAAKILNQSRIIHIVGQRRAFGIASYLNYMLGQFEAPVNLMSFAGGMVDARKSIMGPQDCIIAISFPDYTSQAITSAKEAHEKGLKLISITDSVISPIAGIADVVLLTDPATDAGFRSAVGSMVTAQALAVTYGELKQKA